MNVFIKMPHIKKYYLHNINSYRILSILLFALWCTCAMYSQQVELTKKAKDLIYTNPDEAVKIGEHIIKTLDSKVKMAPVNLLIAKSYYAKGDYNNAIKFVFTADQQVSSQDAITNFNISLFKSELYRVLYLDKQSKNYQDFANNLITNVNSKSLQDSLRIRILIEDIKMKLDRRQNDSALNLINSTFNNYKSHLATNNSIKKELFFTKEKAFFGLTQYDSTFKYIKKSLEINTPNSTNNLVYQASIYNDLGLVFLQKKMFKESEENFFKALAFAGILDNKTLLKQINRNLAINYLASNQKNKHKVYNDEFLILNSKEELIEQESINTLYNLINQEQEQKLVNREKGLKNYLYLALVGILILVLIGAFFQLKNQWRKKRLKEIINYLEISRSNFINMKPTKKVSKKKINIPEETEKNILAKLKRFENSRKFLSKDMSLAVMAGQFETNTKYLSEIINSNYNDNFNTFINKLRINYIIERLKNDSTYMNYKISALAEESGFSSHSSFATVFKSIIGMSPVTFIELLKSEREDKTLNT